MSTTMRPYDPQDEDDDECFTPFEDFTLLVRQALTVTVLIVLAAVVLGLATYLGT